MVSKSYDRLGEANAFVGSEQPEELLAQLASHDAHAGLYVDVGQ